MSIQAMQWAFSASVKPTAAKFVLVALADHADADGHCYPGQELLARKTGQAARTVRRHLAKLEKDGWILRTPRRRRNGSRTSDAFDLNFRTDPVNVSPCGGGEARESQRQVSPVDDTSGEPQNSKRPIWPVDDTSGQLPHSKRSDSTEQPVRLAGPEPSEEPSEEPSKRERAHVAGLFGTDADTENDYADKQARRRGRRLASDWRPSSEAWAFGLRLGFDDDGLNAELDRFRDYWTDQPGQRGRKLDWIGTWRNWLRRATEDRTRGPRTVARRDTGADRPAVVSVVAAVNRLPN